MNESEIQRVALVTGGAVRLGRAITLALAQAGHDILVHFHGSAAAAAEVRAEVEATGRRCATVQANLLDPAAPDTLLDAVRGTFGRLDVLVNSAASFDAHPLLEVDAHRWDQVMALNLRAPHLLVRAAASLLTEARGCVVNLVDLSALQPWTTHPAHAVSKAGLAHLTRVQARALAPRVRVNAIAPGAVLPPDDTAPELLDELRSRTPLQTLGTPDDVVGALLYLVEAPFVTGQVLAVDGGRTLGTSQPVSKNG